ncbi:MAG: hypothetical protein K8W52_03745 [Deltaproteobacteria bacterium]|nr:hypothetical protein [Deltaproteobacteria bacterium]
MKPGKLHLAAVIAIAACGHPHAPTIGNAATGAPSSAVAWALLPPKGDGKALDALEIKVSADEAALALAAVPEDVRTNIDEGATPHYYDLDGDGRFDLYLYPQVYFGPSSGFIVYIRDAAGLREAFGVPGDWTIVKDAEHVLLSYDVLIIDESFESGFRHALEYRLTDHRWNVLPSTFGALKGLVPPAASMARKVTLAATTLRATPAIDDTPTPKDAESEQRTTLRGNALADYAAGAHGVALAEQGDWLYVGLDPAVRPTATAMQHGMAETDVELPEDYESPAYKAAQQSLRSPVWLLGWVPKRAVTSP